MDHTNIYTPHFTTLQEEEYCVIPNILSTEETSTAKEGFWQWLEHLSPNIERTDPSTYYANWPHNSHGIIWMYNVGHAQFLWDVRCNQSLINVFQKYWNDEDLLVSFDGVCAALPSRIKR